MEIPVYVAEAMSRMENNGFECYIVGGCVRDSLLGRTPVDWDICTNAPPATTLSLFDDVPCIPTGLKHGTVTVVWNGIPLEITTYRTEDAYTDGRHPDRVRFVSSIEEDLSRRDFTVNAMAYHPVRGLVDLFGGARDLNDGYLRCVGEASQRFKEDALRILRALRFASCYGFTVEKATAEALEREADGLSQVAAERIRAELDRMLTGAFVGDVLRRFYRILFRVIPELADTRGFHQHSRYHHLDVFEHTVTAVASCVAELPVRLALLLHDVGKPHCFSRDENGQGHFYGHAAISERLAGDILKRLRYDNRTAELVLRLIKYHDTVITADEHLIKRWLNRFGAEFLHYLLLVKEGDCLGQIPSLKEERFGETVAIRCVISKILEQQQCFSLKDLAINGRDVMAQGIREGKRVGETLQWVLDAVIDGALPNDRDVLLEAIQKKT